MTEFYQDWLPEIETELRRQVQKLGQEAEFAPFLSMLTYHMGWSGENAGPKARGKRLRPLLVLLSAAAAGGNWREALPAAAAVELLHNFSLIHDDIQDNSDKRRGRPAVWKQWGMPQAINAGDALFIIANAALLDLGTYHPAERVLKAGRIFLDASLSLTRGQFLDIDYEKRADLPATAYWPMVSGKTAALLAASTELGALLGGAPPEKRAAYREFGRTMGLAFQVQDDILGIWGDEAQTGKSTASDLLEGKKTLPVLYGLEKRGLFYRRWQKGSLTAQEVGDLARVLADEGAFDYAQDTARRLTDQALQALSDARPQDPAGQALQDLTRRLLKRQV